MKASSGSHSEKERRVSAKIDEIEGEMKRIGFWHDNPPDFHAGNYLEAPSFELWLQCVFIPNARRAADTGQYPGDSQVGLMALRQYNYHEVVPAALPLLSLLNEFDTLIVGKKGS
jgi:uncharacterized protein YqcC (DUF446 family)